MSPSGALVVASLVFRCALGEDGATVDTGRSYAELEANSAQMKTGRSYEFPREELAGVLAVYQAARQVFSRQMTGGLEMHSHRAIPLGRGKCGIANARADVPKAASRPLARRSCQTLGPQAHTIRTRFSTLEDGHGTSVRS
jgi:hypothetical protein